MKKILVLMVFSSAFCRIGYTQDPQNSIYSVRDEDKLFQVTVWRRVYMEEKQNQAFFSRNHEISRVLINAVRDGLLIPYKTDSCLNRMTKEEFEDKLVIKTGADEDSWGTGTDTGGKQSGASDPWATGTAGGNSSGNDVWGGAETTQPTTFPRDPTEINILEIKEDIFFDKIRSRMYDAIQSLGIFYTDQNTGLREPVAFFNYREVEKMFRNNPDEAIWYNRQNPAQNRNMADAFLLQLYHGMITKISNPRGISIREEVNDPQLALFLSQQREYKIAEYENDLWEY